MNQTNADAGDDDVEGGKAESVTQKILPAPMTWTRTMKTKNNIDRARISTPA